MTPIPAAEIRKAYHDNPQVLAQLGEGKPSKYRAKPTTYNGVRFASKAEAARARDLDLMLAAHTIAAWDRQPRYALGDVRYVADFVVYDGRGNAWVEDVKGVETPRFRLCKRLWRKYGTMPLHIIRRGGKVEIVNGKDI